MWIGMNDLRTLNYYEWSDDTPVTYTTWYLNEPNGGVGVKMKRCLLHMSKRLGRGPAW